MHKLAAEVQPIGIVGIHGNGRVPIVPQLGGVGVVRLDVGHRTGGDVNAVDVSALGHRVGHVGVARHGHHVKSIAEADLLPILIANAIAVPHVGRGFPRTVVLKSAVDIVRHVVVDVDVVKLTHRQVADEGPSLASIAADVDAAVVSIQDEIRIVGVLVPSVVVWVSAAVGQNHIKCAAAVGALTDHAVEVEEPIGVLRIGMDFRVVKRPVSDVFCGDQVKVLPAVGALVEARLFGFDQGVDDVGVGRTHGEAHAPEHASWKAFIFAELGPVVASIMGHIQSAALATGSEEPRLTVKRPHGGKQLVGVGRIHDHLGTSRGIVNGQHMVPSLAPVPGAEHAALRIGAPSRAHGRHKDRLGVCGVDADAVDGPGVFQAHHGPGGTPINGAVDAPTGSVTVSGVALARSCPDHIGVRGGHRHRANAQDVLVVEQGLPSGAAGRAAPQTATGSTGVDDVAVCGIHSEGGHPATHGSRSDVTDGVILKNRLCPCFQREHHRQQHEPSDTTK